MSTKDNMAMLTAAVQRFTKAYGEAVTEAFKPFGEVAERMREQGRKRRDELT